MRLLFAVLAALATASPGAAFVDALLVPGPTPRTLLVRSEAERETISSYDCALMALWLLDRGRRDEAGQLLAGLAAIQQPDGAIAFSFPRPAPEPGVSYLRAGAMAWVGYAAARYLNDAAGGPQREAITVMAHRLAGWLLAHRIQAPGDPRDGLVSGGVGRYSYDRIGSRLQESFVPGEVNWVSAEHNIDAYFFLRALAQATGSAPYRAAADEIARALVRQLWDDALGQFAQGAMYEPDRTAALDAASWGALLLAATGDRTRATRALDTAERRFASREASGIRGHKPYERRRLIESRAAAEHYQPQLPAERWDQLEAVWPEGSAGVALAALRLGRPERAREILEQLERLRRPAGGLPGLTIGIPTEFSTAPSAAGTLWVDLVRSELETDPGYVGIWKF